MRKLILPAAALAALGVPAAAQEAPAAAPRVAEIEDMADAMRDPGRQHEMAMLAQTMTEVLLDLPIAPLAQAAAELAGEQTRTIDPDTTLRKLVPDADRLSAQVGHNAPRAMQAAGTLLGAMAAMAPALRGMAEQMAAALPPRQ